MSSKVRNAYIIYTFFLLSVLLITIMYIFRSVEMYELYDREYVMDDIVISLKNYNPYSVALSNNETGVTLQEDKNHKLKHKHQSVSYDFAVDYKNISLTPYETDDDYYHYLMDLIVSGQLSYKELSRDADDTITYGIYSDDIHIFNVVLTGSNKRSRLGLNLYDWSPELIDGKCCLEAMPITGPYSIYVSAPKDYSIKINGVTLNEDASTLVSDLILDDLKNTSKYSVIPSIVTYETSGLYKLPVPTISHLGKDVLINENKDNNNFTIYVNSGYETYPVDDNASQIISEAVIGYEKANYENSHIEIEFDNNSFNNYIAYSKDCFSCQVTYTLKTHFNGEVTSQKHTRTYYFVWDYVDDVYKIVDSK